MIQPEINVSSRILLGPGPSMADPRVLKAMATPLLGHLDPQYLELMDGIQIMLREVMQTKNELTFAVAGTGTAAMEASFANMIEPGDRVLICTGGYFANRMAEMAARYGAEVQTITRPWGEVFTADEIEAAIKAHQPKIVGIVHAETSTGTMQPLHDIAKIVHDHDAFLIVDAVTSLGGVPLAIDEIGIDVCYSCSQKALGCPPGASPITFSPAAVERINQRKTPVTNWYLDATLLAKYWGSERVYHHTAPISLNYALYEGLRITLAEGLEARWQRHRDNAEMFWKGLEAQDLVPHVEHSYRLPTLTTVRIPDGVDEARVRSRLLNEYNIEIGSGFGELKGRVWRIGLMGYSSRKENIVLLLAALDELLHQR